LINAVGLSDHSVQFEALDDKPLTIPQMLKSVGVGSLNSLLKLTQHDLVELLEVDKKTATKILRFANAAKRAHKYTEKKQSISTPSMTSTTSSTSKQQPSNEANSSPTATLESQKKDMHFAKDLLVMFPELKNLKQDVERIRNEEDESKAKLVSDGLQQLFPTLTHQQALREEGRDVSNEADFNNRNNIEEDVEDIKDIEETEEEMRLEMEMEYERERLKEESEKRANHMDAIEDEKRQLQEETSKEKKTKQVKKEKLENKKKKRKKVNKKQKEDNMKSKERSKKAKARYKASVSASAKKTERAKKSKETKRAKRATKATKATKTETTEKATKAAKAAKAAKATTNDQQQKEHDNDPRKDKKNNNRDSNADESMFSFFTIWLASLSDNTKRMFVYSIIFLWTIVFQMMLLSPSFLIIGCRSSTKPPSSLFWIGYLGLYGTLKYITNKWFHLDTFGTKIYKLSKASSASSVKYNRYVSICILILFILLAKLGPRWVAPTLITLEAFHWFYTNYYMSPTTLTTSTPSNKGNDDSKDDGTQIEMLVRWSYLIPWNLELLLKNKYTSMPGMTHLKIMSFVHVWTGALCSIFLHVFFRLTYSDLYIFVPFVYCIGLAAGKLILPNKRWNKMLNKYNGVLTGKSKKIDSKKNVEYAGDVDVEDVDDVDDADAEEEEEENTSGESTAETSSSSSSFRTPTKKKKRSNNDEAIRRIDYDLAVKNDDPESEDQRSASDNEFNRISKLLPANSPLLRKIKGTVSPHDRLNPGTPRGRDRRKRVGSYYS
tara:strand:+ start:257 stop:2590 length:2334 start_codon:yes stop_codon:yes gene_type:complete